MFEVLDDGLENDTACSALWSIMSSSFEGEMYY